MSTDARKAALERRHAAIEAELHNLNLHPSADQLAQSQLKREKLRLKDEFSRIRA